MIYNYMSSNTLKVNKVLNSLKVSSTLDVTQDDVQVASLKTEGGLLVKKHIQTKNGIIVGNTEQPIAGTIRFNGTKFQGFNGTTWIDFH